MSYGFSCINNNDIIMIDGVYKNYQVFAVGTVATSDGAAYISAPSNSLLLLSPATLDSVYYTSVYLHSSSEYFIYAFSGGSSLGITRTLHYILLIPRTDITPRGFGLNVYTPSGELAYTSTENSVGFRSVHTRSNSGGTQFFFSSLTAERRLYVESSPFGIRSAFYEQLDIDWYAQWAEYFCFRVGSNYVESSRQNIVVSLGSSATDQTAFPGGISYILLAEY
jgi:hypothetical protein